jgi:hypothetical protein
MPRPSGPIEEVRWPEQLQGHVVTPGSEPRVHGYDVETDLALHYRSSDVSLLSLLGELPTERQSKAFDVALTFLAPLSIAEAPTHAAALARICGSPSNGVLGSAAVALAERAHSVVSDAAPLLEWLASGGKPPPPGVAPANEEDHRAVQRLRDALAARGVEIEALGSSLSRQSALLATLWFAGLTRPEQLETALILASLPSVVAEAFCHRIGSFKDYPTTLPPFAFDEP